MELQKELKGQTVVILANSFNPSIFNQYWLVSKEFIPEGDIQPASVITPGITQIMTPGFHMLVVPDQLQFNYTGDEKFPFQDSLQKTLKPMMEQLKEVPYRAIGLNYVWFVFDPKKSMPALSREMFCFGDAPLFRAFQAEDARFGSYLSRNFETFRVKLDIKPVMIQENESKKEFLQFAFNFHADFDPKHCYRQLEESLNKWDKCLEEAFQIMDQL